MNPSNPAGRSDGTNNYLADERPVASGTARSTSTTPVKTPGIDDGWDSANSRTWAQELSEPNDEARRHAWRDHETPLERTSLHHELEKENGELDADGEPVNAEKLTGELAPLKGPINEAQNKLGLRSLRQADTALHHNIRATQSGIAAATADRVASVSASHQGGLDDQARHRQRGKDA